MSERESMPYDVVIVGGGPAGLAAAIRLKQIDPETTVCILEKGSEIGAHILSGAVVDPRALDELLPNWRDDGCPMAEVEVTENHHWVLSESTHYSVPEAFLPPFLSNEGCYTGSLGNLCRWLAGKAEELGVEIFPGFPAGEVLYDGDKVIGVATQDMGVAKDGSHKGDYQPGMELHAKYTLFAEGARGSLAKQVKAKFDLEANSEPQIYGLGLKELWDIDPDKHFPGRVLHTQGWPIKEEDGFGGAFLYHQANNQVALGYVVWLGYGNPYLSPFEAFQQWKTHPDIAELLKGGRRVSYGARAICDGGLQSLPKLVFPGGALIGCSAGFLNVPRIKGSHTAMKSGMMAAEAAAAALAAQRAGDELTAYPEAFKASWVHEELRKVRNFEPLVARFGGMLGSALAAANLWFEQMRIRMPFTLKHHSDSEQTMRADLFRPIEYPKPDGVISFDRLSSVALSFTNHEEDQPVHLVVKDLELQKVSELGVFGGPSTRYCPAGVYEWLGVEDGQPKYQINAQNCVHCKTCDIKDPNQNITWTTPEGGGGPNYPNM